MKRALVSVSDKTNIVSFCQELIKLNYEIIATGNTKKKLDAANVKNISIEQVTGFPEMLDGRVKTLHPLIHGGLLGLRDKKSHCEAMEKHQIKPIDLVCVNLYPFKKTISQVDCTEEEAIENIDIGGPSMLRSAAKNFRFVTVVCDVNDYDQVIKEIKENNDTTLTTRKRLAAKVFRLTAYYDSLIQNYLDNSLSKDYFTLPMEHYSTLRYGENPHQTADFYTSYENYAYSLGSSLKLHGKELSYNNIQDANATLAILQEFPSSPCVVAVKHMNPCGVALASNLSIAWDKAYSSDPISIFGGLVATNQIIDAEVALKMSKIFLEVIMAPDFTSEALEILTAKKNIRLLKISLTGKQDTKRVVSVNGGLLIQDEDFVNTTKEELKFVTEKVYNDEHTLNDLLFAEKVCKHIKSNAIVLVKDQATVGIGAGQMNRVGAAKIALEQAKEKAVDAILGSDAFFPFNDTVELASKYNIKAIVQPGGSIRDQDSIDKCNELAIAMAFTGKRHFRH